MSYQFNPITILDSSNATGVGSGGSFTVGGGASVGRNFFVGGNLVISGTTTAFSDNIIVLNNNPSNSTDTGIFMQRYSADVSNSNNYSGIIYKETTDDFLFGYGSADPSIGSVTMNTLVPIRALGATFSGGSLNASFNSNTLGNIITTGGNVGIGTTRPSYTLHVAGSIYATGDITAFSDRRLKSDISTIENPLDKVLSMRGVTFRSQITGERSVGVIAQEMEEVLPEVVQNRGEYKGVSYGNIVGVLIEAIKELEGKVRKLQDEKV